MIILYKQCVVEMDPDVADLMLTLQSVFYYIIVSIRRKLPTEKRQQQLVCAGLRVHLILCVFVRVCAFVFCLWWFLRLHALSLHICLFSLQLWPLWPRFNAIRCRVHSAWDVKQENYCAESWSPDDLKQHQAGSREIRLLEVKEKNSFSRKMAKTGTATH